MQQTGPRYLFICTYGRTGSTILMKLFSQAQGCIMRGENRGILIHLFRAIGALHEAQDRPDDTTHSVDDPFFGIHDVKTQTVQDHLITTFRDTVLRPEPDTRVLGFKDVTTNAEHMSETEFGRYVDFLHDGFPGCQVVFLTRKWQALAHSAWYTKRSRKDVRTLVETSNRWFAEAQARHPDTTQVFDRAHIRAGDPKLTALLDFAGLQIPPDVVEQTLAKRLLHMHLGGQRHERDDWQEHLARRVRKVKAFLRPKRRG